MKRWHMRIWNNIMNVVGRVFVEVAFTLFVSLETLRNAQFAKQREWAKQRKKLFKI
jgi:hypothetical protein